MIMHLFCLSKVWNVDAALDKSPGKNLRDFEDFDSSKSQLEQQTSNR